MLQPECSNMKANCLQIFALGALTSVKMWTTRGKNSAKSLTEERKKLGQESGKQETSSHLSWGNNESLGKHTNYNTSRRVHVKKLGPCRRHTHWFSALTSHSWDEFYNQTYRHPSLHFSLSSSQKLKMTVHIVIRVTALETIPKNTTQKL